DAEGVPAGCWNQELYRLLIAGRLRVIVQALRQSRRNGYDLHVIRGNLGSRGVTLPENNQANLGQGRAIKILAALQELRIMGFPPLKGHTDDCLRRQVRLGGSLEGLPAEEIQLRGPPA